MISPFAPFLMSEHELHMFVGMVPLCSRIGAFGAVMSFVLAFVSGCSSEAAQDDDVGGASDEINQGTIDRNAPKSVVKVARADGQPCLGVLVAPRAILSSAACTTDRDMPEMYRVYAHADGDRQVAVSARVTSINLVGPQGEEPFVLVHLDADVGEPAELPSVALPTGAPVKIYGLGADSARENYLSTIGHIQSKEISWGKASSAADWALEIGAPILDGNTVVGLVIGSRDYTVTGLATKWFLGSDIVQPLVSSDGDTTLVDQIREAVAAH
jgi:hypothetical protein